MSYAKHDFSTGIFTDENFDVYERPFAFTPEKRDIYERRLHQLIDMLSFKRRKNSKSEKKFIGKYIWGLGARPDAFGNLSVTVGDGSSKVLWCCHTDSVHPVGGTHEVYLDDALMLRTKDGECLGADDAAGIFILREMIAAGVPGTYVFHREEESGGVGSNWIAENKAAWLTQFKYAIAFDRRGTSSVITHQGSARTASDAFGMSIIPMLPGKYRLDDGGIFTDTDNYRDIIPECTNISVGYFNEHTTRESLDLVHLMHLTDAMLSFDESKLVAARDPSVIEYKKWDSGSWTKYYDSFDNFDYKSRMDKDLVDYAEAPLTGGSRPSSPWTDEGWSKSNSLQTYHGGASKISALNKHKKLKVVGHEVDDTQDYTPASRKGSITMSDIIRLNPEAVAAWLEDEGLSINELLNEIGPYR